MRLRNIDLFWTRWVLLLFFVICSVRASAQIAEHDPILRLMPETEPTLAFWYQHDWPQAKERADQLIAAYPTRGLPYSLRARIHESLGDRDAAKADRIKAFELSSISTFIAYDLAAMQIDDGELEAAAKTLKPLRQRSPKDAYLRLADLQLAIARGDLEASRTRLHRLSQELTRRGITKDRYSHAIGQTRVRLGEALVAGQAFSLGVAQLELALSKRPPNAPELAMRIAELNESEGLLTRAKRGYERVALQPNAASHPELILESERRLAAIAKKITERAELEVRNEAIAKELVDVIDRYRRDPMKPAHKHAVVRVVKPYFDAVIAGGTDMMLRLSKDKPDSVVEPEDIRDLRLQADTVYRDEQGLRVYPTALVKYPHPQRVQRDAIHSFSMKHVPEGYEGALIAEAILFAEHYYERTSGTETAHRLMSEQLRALARVANRLDEPKKQTPIEASLIEVFRLEHRMNYVDADTLREQIKAGHTEAELRPYRDLLAYSWQRRRPAIEKHYTLRFLQAQKKSDTAELDRLASRLYVTGVSDDRLGSLVLEHALNSGDRSFYEGVLARQLACEPDSPYLWSVMAEDAKRKGDTDEMLLRLNAVVRFCDKRDRVAVYGQLRHRANTELKTLEQPFGDRVAVGYWERLQAYEKAAIEAGLPGYRWQPLIEAAAIRIYGLTPKAHWLNAYITRARVAYGDYLGAIDAAQQGIELDPDQAPGFYLTRLGNSYVNLLEPTTVRRAQLEANYLAAIEAYEKAVELEAVPRTNAWAMYGRLYRDIGRYEEAITQFRKVVRDTESDRQRAEAAFQVAQIGRLHNLSDLKRLTADYRAAVDAYAKLATKNTTEMNQAAIAVQQMLELNERLDSADPH